MTLLAAFGALFSRSSGQSDIRLGVPLAGREQPGAANVAGFFVNTVVVRTTPRGEMRAVQLIDEVRERLLGAYANQDVPFASVVKTVQPERELTQTPLFQVLVNQQQRHDLTTSFGDEVRVSVQEVDNGEAQFDLMLNIAEAAGDAFDLTFTYATDVFDASTIERLARHFNGLLEQWATAPDSRIASFQFGELSERATPSMPAAFAYEPITARIALQARERPDAIALVDGDEHFTYAQLDAWSRAIAHELKRLGASAEVRVGVALQRSAALVASLLGVLRAGAAYVPLDPSYPAERLAHIVDDAQLRLIVTDAPSLAQHAALFGARRALDAVALRDTAWADGDGSRPPVRALLLSASSLGLLLLSGCARRPELPDYETVPHFSMTDSQGHAFDSSQLTGKVWAVDFIYTNCPGPCPMMTSQMHRVEKKVEGEPDVRLVSISVDPDRDTPAVLDAFAHKFGGPTPHWVFLTGSPETVHLLAHDVFKVGDLIKLMDHSTKFVVVDKRGHVRGYYSSFDPEGIASLERDIEALR
jgi:cytochrome oxidase Cu insertion factor (SCO1/SenC/PrrC family)